MYVCVHAYICRWLVSLFHVLDMVNNAAVNIGVQISFEVTVKLPFSFAAREPEA